MGDEAPAPRLPRVVFLDIDGPVIPAACFFLDRDASFSRVFSPTCVAAVARLLERADARLVTNSTHSPAANRRTGADLRADLIGAGIPAARFHPDWRTEYPSPPLTRPIGRLEAIRRWLRRNGRHDWVCFDDMRFTRSRRLVVVNPDTGVGVADYGKAAAVFGLNAVRVAV